MIGILKKALGSIEYTANVRLREHLSTNSALMRMKYSFGRRSLESFLKRAFVVYVLVIALFLIDEFLLKRMFPFIARPRPFSMFGEEGDFLSTQVTAIGLIFPIAVSLVTVILERSNATRLDTDIKLYNHASLTYAVGASCLSLVVVYILNLFFSTEGAREIFSYVVDKKLPHSIKDFLDLSYIWVFVPLLHIWWLILNLVALWYFLKRSLEFVQPSQRSVMRQQYAANVLIPADIKHLLLSGFYYDSKSSYLGLGQSDLAVTFGFGYDSVQKAVTRNFNGVYELRDVWMRPLSFFIKRWLKRRRNFSANGQLSNSLYFPPVFNREYSGEVTLCECLGGASLTKLEKFFVRICFRFKKVLPA